MQHSERPAAISLIDVASAPAHVQRVFEGLPSPLRIFRLLGHADGCLRPVVSLGAAILGRQTLAPATREMAILRVAAVTGADYEWSQHVAIGAAVGLGAFEIDAARSGDTAGLSPEWALALRVGESVATEPGLSADLRDECVGTLGEQQTVELVLAAGYYLMLARTMVSFELVPESPAGQALLDVLQNPTGKRATPSR